MDNDPLFKPNNNCFFLLDWYKTLYKDDNTINIKPFDGTHEMLILPLRMPKEYTNWEEYFEDVHFRRNKLHWTVRVSNVGDFYTLKNDPYQWNNKHKGYVTFDNIKAKQVARMGWFVNCHAELYGNQDMQSVTMWLWTMRYLLNMYGMDLWPNEPSLRH